MVIESHSCCDLVDRIGRYVELQPVISAGQICQSPVPKQEKGLSVPGHGFRFFRIATLLTSSSGLLDPCRHGFSQSALWDGIL